MKYRTTILMVILGVVGGLYFHFAYAELVSQDAFLPDASPIVENSLSVNQVNAVVANKNLTDGENYIVTEILAGRVPAYDLTKADTKDIGQDYINALKKLGDPLKDNKEPDLFKRIKNQSNKLLNQ